MRGSTPAVGRSLQRGRGRLLSAGGAGRCDGLLVERLHRGCHAPGPSTPLGAIGTCRAASSRAASQGFRRHKAPLSDPEPRSEISVKVRHPSLAPWRPADSSGFSLRGQPHARTRTLGGLCPHRPSKIGERAVRHRPNPEEEPAPLQCWERALEGRGAPRCGR
jgi:hypothetical protein